MHVVVSQTTGLLKHSPSHPPFMVCAGTRGVIGWLSGMVKTRVPLTSLENTNM